MNHRRFSFEKFLAKNFSQFILYRRYGMSLKVKSLENQELSCVISIGYRGYSIVLHHDSSLYNFCVIADPNSNILDSIRFSCDIFGILRAQRVIDALVD